MIGGPMIDSYLTKSGSHLVFVTRDDQGWRFGPSYVSLVTTTTLTAIPHWWTRCPSCKHLTLLCLRELWDQLDCQVCLPDINQYEAWKEFDWSSSRELRVFAQVDQQEALTSALVLGGYEAARALIP